MTKFQTILLAILCFALAGVAYKFVPNAEAVATGLLALGMYLGGTVRLHPEDREKIEMATKSQDKQAGHATTASLAITYVIAFLFMLVSFVYARPARAEEAPAAKWKHSLTLGVVATMIDFKSGAITLGAPVGSCYGATYVPWEAGLAGCLYAQAATDKTPNMLLSSIQGSYKGNIGLGIGVLKLQGSDGVSMVGFVSGNVPLL